MKCIPCLWIDEKIYQAAYCPVCQEGPLHFVQAGSDSCYDQHVALCRNFLNSPERAGAEEALIAADSDSSASGFATTLTFEEADAAGPEPNQALNIFDLESFRSSLQIPHESFMWRALY